MGFYCENCGEKVDRNSGECSSCGVKFRAVKCPGCGFTASAGEFRNGCPACGYLSDIRDKTGGSVKRKRTGTILSRIPDRVFWILGVLLLLLIPFLIIHLL